MTQPPSTPHLRSPHHSTVATALLKQLAPTAGLLALLASPVHASAISSQQYDFVGTCSDCVGQVHATLMLQNYVAGTSITDASFLSFSYGGSNLLAPYTITEADLARRHAAGGWGSVYSRVFGYVGKSIAPYFIFEIALTNDDNQTILGFGSSGVTGHWSTGSYIDPYAPGDNDNGSGAQWTLNTGSSVPEPASLLLVATALLAGTALRRRAA
jgi:hypothetical protein